MNTLGQIVLANLIISSGSLIGVVTLAASRKFLGKILMSLVSLSAGTMLGAAFIHLMPEAVAELGTLLPFELALGSFLVFFLLEQFFHWRHCHDEAHPAEHTVGYLNLIGDGIHNFLDGLLIAAAFSTSTSLGVISTLAIALHELPQELGDFGVLLHSGFTRRQALFANLAVSLTAVIGGFVGYSMIENASVIASYLLPVAAGSFLYIGAADLVPELKKITTAKRTLAATLSFLLGITLMIIIRD